MKYYIYALYCPLSNQIRYIGQTVQTPKRRFDHHVWESKNLIEINTKKVNWFRKLLKLGKLPELIIIEDGLFENQQQLDNIEIKWISYYKELGCRLVNGTNGGNSVCKKIEKYHRRTEDKKVYSYNEKTNEVLEYKNIKQASEIIGVNRENIPKAIYIKGRCKDLFWSYNNNFEVKQSKNFTKIAVYNESFYKEFDSIWEAMDNLKIPRTCKSRIGYRLNDGLLYKGFYFKRISPKSNAGKKRAHVKQEELLETPITVCEDNQQPSLTSNSFEGSTTNSQIQTSNVEDSNGNTSLLHLNSDDIV